MNALDPTIVAKYDLPWHAVDVDASPPFSVLPDRAVGQPMRAMAMWGQFSGLERVVDGDGTGTVVLSGFGGDQVLAGDLRTPFHLADLLRIGSIGRLLDGLRAWQRATRTAGRCGTTPYRLAIQPAWRHRRGLALTPPERADRAPWIARSFARRVAAEPEAAQSTERHEPFREAELPRPDHPGRAGRSRTLEPSD